MTEVYIANAFCKDGKGSNRAGVVLSRPDLTAAEKQLIAARILHHDGAIDQVFVGGYGSLDGKKVLSL